MRSEWRGYWSSKDKGGALLPVLLLLLFCCWELWPALTSVHIEAFSASLHSMAILIHRHGGSTGLLLSDQLYPVTTQYLYMTRSGLLDCLQIFMAATGHVGDGVFRLLILLSMLVYSGASLSIARRWSGEAFPALLLALVLTPGLVQIAFYYADNLPSAAAAMLGIALIQRKGTSPLHWFAIGALFCAAVLVRLDAILLGPVFAYALIFEEGRMATRARRAACFVAGSALVLLLALSLTPFNMADALRISSVFSKMHETYGGHKREVVVLTSFFGLVTPVLAALGAWRNLRAYRWPWHLAFTVYPILFYLFVAPRALETRVFLLLGAPPLLIASAAGMRYLYESWVNCQLRALSVALMGWTALFLFSPPLLAMYDGPRSMVGYLWSPIVWHEWQADTQSGMKQLDDFVNAIPSDARVLAVSTHSNADRYLRLHLLENGYDIEPESKTRGRCSDLVEVFNKGARTVVHVRSEQPYSIAEQLFGVPPTSVQAYELNQELACVREEQFTSTFLISWAELPTFFPSAFLDEKRPPPWGRSYPTKRWLPSLRSTVYGVIDIRRINEQHLLALEEKSGSYKDPSGRKGELSMAKIHSMYSWRR